MTQSLQDKISKAKEAGYKDVEILQHLEKSDSQLGTKIRSAMDSGYKVDEVVEHLSKRTAGQEASRQVGLTARAAVSGIAAPIVMGADFIAGVGNLPFKAAGSDKEPFGRPSESFNKALDRFLPAPETPTERVVQGATSAMAGAGSMAQTANALVNRAAGPVMQNALRVMSSNPGMQVASAAAGSGAAGIGAENGVGPLGQLGLAVAGGLSPYAAQYGGATAVKGLLRGGEAGRQKVENNLRTFGDAGTTPSVGQATESRGVRAFESLLAKTPGSAGRMVGKAESQAAEMGNQAEGIASKLAPKSNPTLAGRMIEKGLSGEKGFIDRFKAKSGQLYDELDKFIPQDKKIEVSNTKQALSDLNADIPSAPALSEWFKNAKIQGIEKALNKDVKTNAPSSFEANPTGPSLLPYEAMKKLRTLVGRELESNSIAADVPRSKWKALYAALSTDLEAAAGASGKGAQQAFSRANAFTRSGHDRIDGILDSVASKNVPEQIFQAATGSSDMKNGATTINAVMRSLQPAERNVVKSAFIRRMGVATPGNQGADGDVFSTQTFLTNWNKMSPEAKSVMFSGDNGGLRKSLDQLANASENIKAGSKVFSNPSGTSQAISNQAAIGGSLWALATGHPLLAGGAAATALSSNLSARLMTNQKFVQWLAKSTKMPASAIPANIQNLTRAMAGESNETKKDVQEYVKGISSQEAQ